MKSVRHRGLAFVAVSSSVIGAGLGMMPGASAVAWDFTRPGPAVALNVTASVSGTGASAVLTVHTDSTGSAGINNTTDFGDGSKPATTTIATHSYAAGALKQTLTESSADILGGSTPSTIQVAVDATDPSHIVYTRSTPINLAAAGAVVTSHGDSALDLGKVLPAGADLSQVSGTCDLKAGAPALSVDLATGLATCDWPVAPAGGAHTITVNYTDKATGLKTSSWEFVSVPQQPVTTMQVAVLAKGLVQLDLTGSGMETASGPGAGIIDWGDGTTTSVPMPLHNNELQTHQYTTVVNGWPTITFSITDQYGEHASTSAKVDYQTPTVNYGQLTRVAGATRYGTGVAASQQAFPFAHTANAVVLARGDTYADALTGIPLAKLTEGPLLLTPGGPTAHSLDPNVAAEIKRVLSPHSTVYILGGTEAIPQSIEDYLKNSLGVTVLRFGGADRYATAVDIMKGERAMGDPPRIVVARGDDFADALAAGPFASDRFVSRHEHPAAILLSSGNGVDEPVSLTPDTRAAIIDRLNAPPADGAEPNVAAIGGGAVKAVAAVSPDPSRFTAIAGTDRYDTAAKVAGSWGRPVVTVGVASGVNFPDSLTGGAQMANMGSPLLLTNPNAASGLSAPAGAFLTGHQAALMNTYLFGGSQVFPFPVANRIMQLEGVSIAHYRTVELPY